MTPEQKTFIDNADYYTLLKLWRFAEPGTEMFQGETGEYYAQVMFAKRDAMGDGAVAVSKAIGW